MFEYILEIPLGAFFKTEVCKPIKNSGFVKKTTKKLGSLGTLQELVKKGGVKKKEKKQDQKWSMTARYNDCNAMS